MPGCAARIQSMDLSDAMIWYGLYSIPLLLGTTIWGCIKKPNSYLLDPYSFVIVSFSAYRLSMFVALYIFFLLPIFQLKPDVSHFAPGHDPLAWDFYITLYNDRPPLAKYQRHSSIDSSASLPI